jgi:putative dehydrogenase
MHSKDVGIIGLGAMGFPMAKNLLRSGFTVFGFHIDQQALKNFQATRGRAVPSPTELAQSRHAVALHG